MTPQHKVFEPKAAAPPREEEYDLRYVVKVLRRRRNVIIATVIALTTLATLLALNLTPRYTAEATIVIEPRSTRIVNFDDERPRELPQDTSVVNTHVRFLTSTSFVDRVIDELQLLEDPEFNIALRDEKEPDALDTFIVDAFSWVKAPLVAVGLANDSGVGSPAWPQDDGQGNDAAISGGGEDELDAPSVIDDVKETARAAIRAEAANIFREQLAVGSAGRSYAVAVTFTSTDPETAARVANAMAELYVEHQLESKQATTTGALEWLDKRLDELRAQLVQAEQAAEAYRAENQLLIASGNSGSLPGQHELTALEQELIRARAERVAEEAKLGRIRQLRETRESLDALPEVMTSSVIADLRQQQTQLLREEAQLRKEYGARHPSIVQIQAEKDNLAARIDAEILNIIGSIENQIATIQVREEALRVNLDRAKAGAVQTNRAAIQLRLLEREAASTRDLYALFLNRFKELTEQREMLDPGVRVISAAAVPTKPSFPQVKLMAGAGFMGSLMLAMLLAFVVDRLDRGIRTGRQAEEVLQIPHIGFVPKVRRLSRLGPERYLAERPASTYAEAIRTVQTALYFSNVDRPPQIVLVTSSLPAEGKTTFALSLAAMLARSGCKTVAVDLDLRRPALGRGFDENEGGDLIDLITREKALDEVLHPAGEIENLDILPVKRITASPTDLLSSQKMVSIIDDLRTRYDYIILDSPPLLGISDSRFATLLADTVVFVVRWGKTSDELATKALDIVRESGASIAGAVLTQVNVRRHRKYGPEDVVHYYGKYKGYYVN